MHVNYVAFSRGIILVINVYLVEARQCIKVGKLLSVRLVRFVDNNNSYFV